MAARQREWGESHYKWRGDAVGRIQAHAWLNRNNPKSGVCERCGEHRKTHLAFKGANGEWSRNRDDYLELCPSCHKRFDLAKSATEGDPAKEEGNHG